MAAKLQNTQWSSYPATQTPGTNVHIKVEDRRYSIKSPGLDEVCPATTTGPPARQDKHGDHVKPAIPILLKWHQRTSYTHQLFHRLRHATKAANENKPAKRAEKQFHYHRPSTNHWEQGGKIGAKIGN
ncbi:hypothetical protein BaRGS_00000362 [Batillaria attramentaria]|uniref:Uncharacterized protein n=1 Tax=Batillaria attramentaria TaxID=370345 RepID=A0ABD0M9F8_9CAEN